MMMHEQQQATLDRWTTPPLLLVRPKVSHIGWFSFAHVEELLQMGYDAMQAALGHLDTMLAAPGGIFPRTEVAIVVDRPKCTGCALCVARSPGLMALDAQRKAYALVRVHEFSPADGAVAACCPTGAISIQPVRSNDDVVDAGLEINPSSGASLRDRSVT